MGFSVGVRGLNAIIYNGHESTCRQTRVVLNVSPLRSPDAATEVYRTAAYAKISSIAKVVTLCQTVVFGDSWGLSAIDPWIVLGFPRVPSIFAFLSLVAGGFIGSKLGCLGYHHGRAMDADILCSNLSCGRSWIVTNHGGLWWVLLWLFVVVVVVWLERLVVI